MRVSIQLRNVSRFVQELDLISKVTPCRGYPQLVDNKSIIAGPATVDQSTVANQHTKWNKMNHLKI